MADTEGGGDQGKHDKREGEQKRGGRCTPTEHGRMNPLGICASWKHLSSHSTSYIGDMAVNPKGTPEMARCRHLEIL